MTEIRKTTGPIPQATGAKPAAGKASPETAKLAADGAAISQQPPTDTKLAMKVLKGLELPPKPRIMWRDATRDAWVRDAAHVLMRAEKVLDLLRDAALDPRTPVSEADWAAAKAKVKALGDAIAATDKNGVRIEAFEGLMAPHRDALRAAAHYPAAPADPKAREAWKAQGEAVLARAEAATRALDELAADTGVDPWAMKLHDGTFVHGPGGDRITDALAAKLNAPVPGKLETLGSLIKAVVEVAGAVEIGPNGQLRERRR